MPNHTPTKQVSFDVSVEDAALIRAIVKRAEEMFSDAASDPLSLEMDLTATHANGTPLRLADLLAADDFNFAHDIFGIMRHINRVTGQLQDCFLPRFAK